MSKLSKKSICGRCEWYDYAQSTDTHYCAAFPPYAPYNGIPDKYITGEEKHLQIDKGQLLDVYFEDKEPFPKL